VLREFREGCASGSKEALRGVQVGSFGEIDEVLDQILPGCGPLVDLSRHRADAVSAICSLVAGREACPCFFADCPPFLIVEDALGCA